VRPMPLVQICRPLALSSSLSTNRFDASWKFCVFALVLSLKTVLVIDRKTESIRSTSTISLSTKEAEKWTLVGEHDQLTRSNFGFCFVILGRWQLVFHRGMAVSAMIAIGNDHNMGRKPCAKAQRLISGHAPTFRCSPTYDRRLSIHGRDARATRTGSVLPCGVQREVSKMWVMMIAMS
jgi:hypothetical protein